MTDSFNCDRFADALSDFLERDVSESTRAAMESHALSCDDCGPLLADLRRLRIDATNLPELAPSRDLWSGISERIETPVVELPGRERSSAARTRRRFTREVWLGVAAAGLVVVTATVTREVTKRGIAPAASKTPSVSGASSVPNAPSVAANAPSTAKPPVDSTTAAAPATTVASAAKSGAVKPTAAGSAAASRPAATRAGVTPTRLASNAKPSAEATYDVEIAKLRAVLNYRRNDLDSTTVAVVDKNLKIIDDAIAQCRLALKKDPASRFLLESLNDALDSKVQLLRTAATLPPRA